MAEARAETSFAREQRKQRRKEIPTENGGRKGGNEFRKNPKKLQNNSEKEYKTVPSEGNGKRRGGGEEAQ